MRQKFEEFTVSCDHLSVLILVSLEHHNCKVISSWNITTNVGDHCNGIAALRLVNVTEICNLCAPEACPSAGNVLQISGCLFSAADTTFSPDITTRPGSNATCVPYVDPNISTGSNLGFYQVCSLMAFWHNMFLASKGLLCVWLLELWLLIMLIATGKSCKSVTNVCA